MTPLVDTIYNSFKKTVIIFLIAFSSNVFAQDTLINYRPLKKLTISTYLDFPLIYQEPGIQFQYFIKENRYEKYYFELKYGFSFVDFNIYSDANDIAVLPISGNEPKFHFSAGYGSIIKFGYGHMNNTFFRSNGAFEKSCTHEYRFTYKDLFFPTYLYYDGDPQSDYTPIYRQNERRRVVVINYVLGKQFYRQGIFGIDFNLIFGGAYEIRYIKQYSVGTSSSEREEINSPLMVKTITRPSLGFEFILHLTTFEKNFKR